MISADAKLVTDRMISVAAHSISDIVDASRAGAAVLPPVSELPEFSRTVAIAVAGEAVKEGLNRRAVDNVADAVDAQRWSPTYRELA